MELREWLPLVISGVLGLAGIIAGLWGTLATLRAQRQRDDRAAMERTEQADRDAQAARLAHLLDERRSAYADLIAASMEMADLIHQRMRVAHPSVDYEETDYSRSPVKRTRDGIALVQLLAPPDVGAEVRKALAPLMLGDIDSLNYARTGQDSGGVWRSIHDADEAVGDIIRVLNADLVPSHAK
ncbi:hypothetical protein [Isoptericola dokdonensis]|uniref:Uncharacterized protein n=1 Tax=Isoptericola dokdonensis DS-3 TaxID=1300344 RepID=A0A168EEB4_9MICO|nr:hypothetical protein [Isoptericola dokdonensis]ANC29932.1 hypothetical protein I598_0344 [Isoptericola dokdonensis DS-3]